MIPVLYKANETDFTHLGLGVLMDTLRAEVTEERNGVFELELDYPVDGQLFNSLKNDRLIRVNASPQLSDQRFRIVHMEKKANQIMTVYAEHVSYLSQDLALNPTVNYSGTAQNALNTWSSNIVDSHPFTTFSDISHSANGRWEIEDVENARRALGGVRGSLLDSYGGEYRFDNYHIQLWQDRGKDSGVLIAYGKNLVDLEQEEEITSTYTSIYPYAIAEDENGNQGERITLPELFIDSEHVDKYARRKILVVDFSQDEVKTVEALRLRAEQYIEANNIGVPKVNIRVSFQDLAKTLDYKDLSLVEEINLCDTVDVYYEKLDIQTNAKIIKTVWNALLDEYKELEIGEARSSLSQAVNNIVDGKVDEVDRRVNRVQIAANGKNRIFRGADEPTQGMSLNDLWYKPVGQGETELYRFNGNIWTLEKVSAGLLGGTLDAENGDVNLINVNVANIVGNRSEFIQSWWNGIDSTVQINSDGIFSEAGNHRSHLHAGQLSFKHLARNAETKIDGNGIRGIKNGTSTDYERLLDFTDEGMRIQYISGTGTQANTSLILDGAGQASFQYIDFNGGQTSGGVNRARIEHVGPNFRILHPNGGRITVTNRSRDVDGGSLDSNAFTTLSSQDAVITMVHDRLQTPRNGTRDIYIAPNGQGKVRVANNNRDYYPIRASDFENASSRELKTAIEPYRGSALDVINGLDVVEYYMKKDIREGHYNKYVGLISEDSPEVSSQDGKSIMSYAVDAYLIKAVQELTNKVRELESHVNN